MPWEALQGRDDLPLFKRLGFDELHAAHYAVETLGSSEAVSIARAWLLVLMTVDALADDERGVEGELRDEWLKARQKIETLRGAFLTRVRHEVLGE